MGFRFAGWVRGFRGRRVGWRARDVREAGGVEGESGEGFGNDGVGGS